MTAVLPGDSFRGSSSNRSARGTRARMLRLPARAVSTVGSTTAAEPTANLTDLRLVVSGARVRFGTGAFVVSIIVALTGALVALLALNTALAQDSFRLTDLRQQARDLTSLEQSLSTEVTQAASPTGLAQRAKSIGMVPAGSPNFVVLEDGKVLGDGTRAVAPLPAKPKKKKEVDTTQLPMSAATLVPGGASAQAGSEGSAGTATGSTATGGSSEGEQLTGLVPAPAGALR